MATRPAEEDALALSSRLRAIDWISLLAFLSPVIIATANTLGAFG